MNEAKHTPAPWIAKGTRVTSENGKWFNIEFTTSLEEAYANARLVAAAPELLEALKNIERAAAGEIIWPEMLSWEDTINRARNEALAAIAKAEGK